MIEFRVFVFPCVHLNLEVDVSETGTDWIEKLGHWMPQCHCILNFISSMKFKLLSSWYVRWDQQATRAVCLGCKEFLYAEGYFKYTTLRG